MQVSSDSGSRAAVAVVGHSGDLHLCTHASPDTSNQKLQVLTRLEPFDYALTGITAVHLCAAEICAPEPVLWTSASNDRIVAIGLASSHVLGEFRRPGLDSGGVVAMAGNSTHLIT